MSFNWRKPKRSANPHPFRPHLTWCFAGDSLTKMAASTSRTTGKLTASLVVTAACLPTRAQPPHPPPSRQTSPRPERRGRRLSSAGPSPVPSRSKESNNAAKELPDAEAARAAGVGDGPATPQVAADQGGTEMRRDAPRRSSTGTLGKGRRASAAAAPVAGAAGDDTSGETQPPNSPRCRERSSGKLRGGDLM